MSTSKTLSALALLAALLPAACNADESGLREPSPDEWSSMTPNERASFLEERLEEAAEQYRKASTVEAWTVANEEVARSLSLLRAELWTTERARYVAREAELEALAEQTRP